MEDVNHSTVLQANRYSWVTILKRFIFDLLRDGRVCDVRRGRLESRSDGHFRGLSNKVNREKRGLAQE